MEMQATHLDRGLDILAEDPEHADIDNKRTHSLDAIVVIGGPESVGHPKDPVYSNQDKLTTLMTEINDLHLWVPAGEGQPAETLDHIHHELQNLSIALHWPPPTAPAEPLGQVIWQHMDTLCTMQKQSNLTNSLLQDMPVFNEHDSTKLEDWLTDIEMAADLTSESRARLAKARSRGLTHTLVTEAITPNKSWGEIKDLSWLKLGNANIHTYTSCFMEIQQQEKKSLTAYVYQFKTEAKICNFTNDAATIRIFIKGLKNSHGLATCIYEKGPQTLSDTISKAKKLNVVQQLTAMISPPSTVNTMSNDEDCCFQHQEQGHIARNCPNIRSFKCDEYGYIVMACPHRIPPLGTPAKHHQPKPHKSHHARSSSRHHCEHRDRQSCSRSQSHFYRHHSSSHHDSYRNCSRSWLRDNHHYPRSSSQHSSSIYRGYSHQSHHDTPHWPHHISSVHKSSSSYHSRDWSHLHSCPSYKSSRQYSHRSHLHSSRSWSKPHHKRNTRVKIEDPHMDYYSSDDHSSDSGEETDHLN